MASDQDRWAELFDTSQKVVCYQVNAADDITVINYHSTVSSANTEAATSNKYKVAINWWHSDIEQLPVGPHGHPDADEDLPAWIDAVPA